VKRFSYMGVLGLSTTRAKASTATWAALARKSAGAQASTIALGVKTSSISTIRLPETPLLPLGGHAECALHIAGPLWARQSDQLLCPTRALQHLGLQLCGRSPRQAHPTG